MNPDDGFSKPDDGFSKLDDGCSELDDGIYIGLWVISIRMGSSYRVGFVSRNATAPISIPCHKTVRLRLRVDSYEGCVLDEFSS
jgi:hypothetical protein